jgi:Asp-tRNA(Asn)/Glu-tRNA(Gln) amidotransferase C subunit
MQRNELEKLGLEKDAIDQIMALHGRDIEANKAKVSAAEAERDGLKSQLDEAAKAIEGFKALDIEGVKKSADEWKAKAEQAQKDAEKQVYQVRYESALSDALKAAKAKNVKAVRALLNEADLKLTDDGLVGLKEQLEKVKPENDYLFESDVPTPKIVSGGGNKPIENQDAVVIAARKAAGLQ